MAFDGGEVCRRGEHGLEPAASYVRNHWLYRTFEPFRPGDRELALISRDYEATAVLDLVTGEVIAQEDEEHRGFCPVGFYVPDWWNIHDGSVIQGSKHWCPGKEWPNGDFGFVWACHWGDDSSWKLQPLDLSRVSEGIVTRSERFGYLELADDGWEPAWLDVDRERTAPTSRPPAFLRVWIESGEARVGVGADFAPGLLAFSPFASAKCARGDSLPKRTLKPPGHIDSALVDHQGGKHVEPDTHSHRGRPGVPLAR